MSVCRAAALGGDREVEAMAETPGNLRGLH